MRCTAFTVADCGGPRHGIEVSSPRTRGADNPLVFGGFSRRAADAAATFLTTDYLTPQPVRQVLARSGGRRRPPTATRAWHRSADDGLVTTNTG